MPTRAYLSNISPLWPVKRQEELLRGVMPGWPKGCIVFRDELDPRERRAHKSESLAGRAGLLRSTSRSQSGETLLIVSLAVLAWSAEDMMAALTAAASRGAVVRVLDADLEIGPSADAAVLHRAAEAFAAARKRAHELVRGETGGRKSAEKRSAEAKAKAETIRPYWCLPTSEYPTPSLLRQAGVSMNTAKLYLGPRPAAQRAHQASLKRQQSKAEKRHAL